jgi:hypothetical protein
MIVFLKTMGVIAVLGLAVTQCRMQPRLNTYENREPVPMVRELPEHLIKPTPSEKEPPFELTEFNITDAEVEGYTKLTGRVKNKLDVEVCHVQIVYEITSPSGQLADSSVTFTEASRIPPNTEAGFTTYNNNVTTGSAVKVTDVSGRICD